MRKFLTLPLLAALLAAGAWAQRKPLTIERLFSEPSLSGRLPSAAAWSPDGKTLSFVQREGQKAAIWALDVASGQRRVLVDSAKAGFSPSSYQWSPRGSELLLVNEGQLHLFHIAAGTSKRLASGSGPVDDPKFSPDGNWISYARDYNLYALNLSTGKEIALTQGGREELMKATLDWVYPEELDIHTAYWWSPDSARIAYLEMDERPVTRYPLVDFLPYRGKLAHERYPKAGDANPIVRVAVAGLKDKKTQWMDIGRETDIYIPRLDWLPDSRRVAIQRLNRAQTKLELLIADASSGRSQAVLADEDRAWINLHHDLRFFSDGQRFLWSSERDGFRHLYTYDVTGRQVAQLTRGRWGVVSVEGFDEKTGAVFFLSGRCLPGRSGGPETNCPLERHLDRIALSGSEPATVTREAGWHNVSLSPDATHFLDTYSNATAPPRMDLYRIDGSRQSVIAEHNPPQRAELDSYGLVPPDFLRVKGADGTMLNAMMIKPPGFDPAKKYPVLVYVYGGPLVGQVVRNAWSGDRFLWHQLMAQKGYVIFSLDNRGMAGAVMGHAFEAQIHRRMGEVELADQLAGVAYLKSLPFVDPNRIGIWGWSYGGYMTCLAMLKAPDVFRAGAAGAPVTDWRNYDTIYTERYMGRPQENPEGYRNSSPVTFAPRLRGKLLLIHGTSDDNVHLQNTIQLADELIKAGKQFDLALYPGKSHGIRGREALLHLYNRLTKFFLDNL